MARDAFLGGSGMVDSGNPFAGGGGAPMQSNAMVGPMSAPAAVGYQVTLSNGQRIMVNGEADFLKLKEWFGSQATEMPGATLGGDQGRGYGRGGGGGGGGMGGGRFLRTGADTMEAVAGFMHDRNIRRRMDDIKTALADAATQRAALAKLADVNPTQTTLINAVLGYIDSQNAVNQAALAALDDELTAVDLATGGAVARVLDDFGVGRSFGRGDGSGMTSALIAGGVGLGLGALFFNRSSSR